MTSVEEKLYSTFLDHQLRAKLRNDLKELLDQSKGSLMADKVTKVEEFLREKHYLFEAYNYNLRTTNVECYKIKTERAKQSI